MTTQTAKQKPEIKKGKPHPPRHIMKNFGRLFGAAMMLAGSLMLTPNFINNKGGNIIMAQTQVKKEEEIKKTIVLTKETFYTFLNCLKTGDKKYSARLKELLNTEVGGKKLSNDPVFKETFNKFLDGRLAGDPGLAKFVIAYKKDKKTMDPAKIIKTVEDLYLSESLEEAIKKYGKGTVEAFWHMSVWRLASHTVNTINSAFDYDNLTSAKEEYKRLAKDFKLFGHLLVEYQSFVDTFTEMLEKKAPPEFKKLWNAYWTQFGEVTTINKILKGMDDCRNLLEDETKGKKAAEEKYGKDFVSLTASTLGMKAVPKKTEKEPNPKELKELFENGHLTEFLLYTELSKNPANKAKEEDSTRIKAFQLIFNELMLKDSAFRKYLKEGYPTALKKGKKIKVDGNYPTARTPIRAVNTFLREKALEPDHKFLTVLVDEGVYPHMLRKKEQLDAATIKSMALYLGIEPKPPEAKPLEEQTKDLSSAEKEFYETYLMGWLEEKENDYVIRLAGVIDYFTKEVRGGKLKTPFSYNQLDSKLKYLESGGYMHSRVLSFKPSKVSVAILSGKGIGNALQTLSIGQNSIGSNSAEVRIAAVELILDTVVAGADTFFRGENAPNYKNKLKKTKIKIDGKYDAKVEGETLKVVQDFLFNYAKTNDAFYTALKDMGVDYLTDIKATGRFDENTARALAVYITVISGTWKTEKESLEKAEKAEKAEKVKEGVKKTTLKKPEPTGEVKFTFK